MAWEKLGKLFDPVRSPDFGDFDGFAQSPQALVFDEFVRIYFSIRKRTADQKYVSHIQYIEMDKRFTTILAVSRKPVIEPGKLGAFDEHGIFPMNFLRVGGEIYGYTSGWTRRRSVSVDTGIGLAVSTDQGKNFLRMGDGPILTASLHEPFLVCDPFVQRFGGVFHMWYIYGTRWFRYEGQDQPDRTYVIGHALSPDGISWRKEGRAIVSPRTETECQALPTVIQRGGAFHMYFCHRQSCDFRRNRDNGYRIGHAFSPDLINWVRDDEGVGIDVSAAGWDSEMMCYPHVFACEGQIYMLYNGNAFGREGFGLARWCDSP